MKDNREEQKASIESDIDSLTTRYDLSDVAKRAIKKICEFDKLGTKHGTMEGEGCRTFTHITD